MIDRIERETLECKLFGRGIRIASFAGLSCKVMGEAILRLLRFLLGSRGSSDEPPWLVRYSLKLFRKIKNPTIVSDLPRDV